MDSPGLLDFQSHITPPPPDQLSVTSWLCLPSSGHHFAILWASVANTVPACFWATYNLVSQPEALRAVRRQIHEVLSPSGVEASGVKDVTLSREQLDKLTYLGTSGRVH